MRKLLTASFLLLAPMLLPLSATAAQPTWRLTESPSIRDSHFDVLAVARQARGSMSAGCVLPAHGDRQELRLYFSPPGLAAKPLTIATVRFSFDRRQFGTLRGRVDELGTGIFISGSSAPDAHREVADFMRELISRRGLVIEIEIEGQDPVRTSFDLLGSAQPVRRVMGSCLRS